MTKPDNNDPQAAAFCELAFDSLRTRSGDSSLLFSLPSSRHLMNQNFSSICLSDMLGLGSVCRAEIKLILHISSSDRALPHRCTSPSCAPRCLLHVHSLFSLCFQSFYLVQGNGVSVFALTTKHATLKHAFGHFAHPAVTGLDCFHYSAAELKHCLVHYSVSEFILSEINQQLLVRVSGLTGRVPRDVWKQAFLR